jgi:alanyl-tRNA synthetase
MDHHTIRRLFLSFFEERGHQVVPSSPLVPAEDPTLLFTNAGMNQFKDVFLGREKREYGRAASCQKCMRVSGKHNDFENVGHTPWHHTFFEMLGNFSFGDYFKREAMRYAWDLVTEGYGIDPDRIRATVFEDDDEAATLWQEEVGLSANRVFRLGAKENFWSMGETGPCGPCSELHYDFGEAAGCGKPECDPACDCGRYTEFWNLVFIQFNRDAEGELQELPQKCVDTGMGMERLTALIQGVASNYDTDLFRPILDRLGEVTGTRYGESADGDLSLRICADHVRAAAFLVADGVLPSNEGRGYVLRKTLRRALQHGNRLGMAGPFLHRVAGSVIEAMGEHHEELPASRELIERSIEQEERSFGRVLEQGDAEVAKMLGRIEKGGGGLVSGEDAFRLHDTFGYPRDRLREMAAARGLEVDWEVYEREMDAQRERARDRAGRQSEAEQFAEVLFEESLPPTEFVGYVRPEGEWIECDGCTIQMLFTESHGEAGFWADRLKRGMQGYVLLDRTPFYADAGGQVGDQGQLLDPDSREVIAEVSETIYVGPPERRYFLHRVEAKREMNRGQAIDARIPSRERWATMRNHTATHLLHRALKDVLGEHVRQGGSVVEPARLRFDFSPSEGLSPEQLSEIEARVNAAVMADHPVATRDLSLEEARGLGAQMLFGEKYGERVRVVSVGGSFGEDDLSKEFCGGTHCERTGEVGLFRITEERGVAAGVRRIEAVTGTGVLDLSRREREVLGELERGLNVPLHDLPGRVEALRGEVRRLKKELEATQQRAALGASGGSGDETREVAGVRVETRRVAEMEVRGLRDLADSLRHRVESDVLVLGSARGGKGAIVVSVSKGAASVGLDAREVVRKLAAFLGGGGSGRPDMAWGGGREGGKVGEALAAAFGAVEELLAGGGGGDG